MSGSQLLNVDELLKTACEHADLQDYGDMEFVEGLQQLVDSLNHEADLPAWGMREMRKRLLRLLVNRLRIERDLKAHPEILEQSLLPPVVICSPPRTGTTKLHRLLSVTGDFLVMPFWQGHNPAPFPDALPGQPDPRIEATRQFEAWMDKTSPDMKAVHPMYTEEPEEEMLLQEFSFRSVYSVGFARVPSYVAWLYQQDMHRPYEYMKQLLQYLQWQFHQGKQKPWLLKAPTNLGFEPIIENVFPGAKFIMPHRDIKTVLPSVCGVGRTFRALYADEVHREQFGEWALGGLQQQINGHIMWRDAQPNPPVLDLSFEEILQQEMQTAEKVYHFLSMSLSDTARGRVQQRIEQQDRHYRSSHSYTLEEYGLNAEVIDQTFTDYNQRFSAYLQPAQGE